MEEAGPSTQFTFRQSTAQPSPKKSPKKHPSRNAKFRQNNNNSSPKRSPNDPSSSNNIQNAISIPIRSENEFTSANKTQGDPIPRCLPSNNPFSSAIKTHQNKHTPKVSKENAISEYRVPSVDSLKITINNNGVPAQRIVQNDVIQPERVLQNNLVELRVLQNNINQPQTVFSNNVIQPRIFQNNVRVAPKDVTQPRMVFQNDTIRLQRTVQSDATAARPFQFRFPQSIPFEYDPPRKGSYKNNAQPFLRALQGQNKEHSQQVNSEPSYSQKKQQQVGLQQPLQLQPQQHQPLQQPQQQQQQQQQQRPNWRQRKLYNEEQDFYKKVIVTGFPAYTKPEELVRKLSVFGPPQLEVCKNRVAVILFKSDLEAIAAIQANDTIPMYGTILSIFKYTSRRHVQDLIRANRRDVRHEHKGPPVAAPTEIDLSGDFPQQMQNIEAAIRLTQEEVEKINLLFEDIEKYMRMIFPMCEAVPFGSITTGQGIKSSDADCFLSLKPGSNGRPGPGAAEHCSQFVNQAARVLRLHPDLFAHIVSIPRANTPIIKFLHLPTNVNCDLNSKTPLGVQNSRLVGHLLRRDPRFGSVALLLKYWARVQQLSGTGRLTNYALLLLLVFYLQRSLLPPVYKLQGPAHSFMIENWDAGFDSSPLPFLREVPPLRDLLGGFFLYYAGFDFDNLAVCPFMGHPLRKAEFESNDLPAQYALYRRNIAERQALPVRTSCCLCVQDPFELSHNVASAVTCRLAADIKAHIKLAATAYTQEEKCPGDFIRTILLTRPPSLESLKDARVTTRMLLSSRLLNKLDDNWQQTVRDTMLNDIFKDMLFVELTRQDAVSRERDIELEMYYGNINRPIWKRGNNMNVRCPTPTDMLKLHREVTERIVRDSANIPDVRVPFEVEFGFRSKPRGLFITTSPLEGAEEAAFRSFRQFAHTFIHRWHNEFLKPYLSKNPKVEDTVKNEPKTPTIPKKTSPKKTSPKKSKRPNEGSTEPILDRKDISDPDTTTSDVDPPIASVAFVNSNQKDLSESVAAISLIDSSKQNSKSDSNEET